MGRGAGSKEKRGQDLKHYCNCRHYSTSFNYPGAPPERRTTFRLEYRLRRHDGQYRWAIDSAAPRLGPTGEFLGYIGSVLDGTEEKKRQEELRRSETLLAEAQ